MKETELSTPQQRPLDGGQPLSTPWNQDLPGLASIRSHRSSPEKVASPRISDSGDSDPQLDSPRAGLKPRDNNKQSRFLQNAWILGLVALAFVSFLLLFSTFSGNFKGGPGDEKVSLHSFRGSNTFFPCDSLGNPSCEAEEPLPVKPDRDIDTRQALDYVTKREPPPGFEQWVQFAAENQCLTGSYSRIDKDMEAFRDTKTGKLRILKRHIEGAKKMARVAVFTVDNGRVESYGDNDYLQGEFKGLMSRFVGNLPDMEFVVNMMDEPRVLPGNTDDVDERMSSPVCFNASESFQKYRHLHGFFNNRQTGPSYDPNPELVALFSQAKINECHRDIMFPTLYTLESYLPPEDEAQLIPWKDRDEVLFFRGSTTGGIFEDAKTEGLSHRQRLVKAAKGQPNMDIGFTSVLQCSWEVCNEMEKKYGLAEKVPYMDNFKHKYLVSIDGNSFVSRLPRFMQSASLMFRIGIFDEWYEEWLEEGKHYLRVALDYSDLTAKLKWAMGNDALAKKIGLEARDFSKKHLRKQDMECYLYRLLLEYANILEL